MTPPSLPSQALSMLRVLRDHGVPMSNCNIAQSIGCHRSNVRRLLARTVVAGLTRSTLATGATQWPRIELVPDSLAAVDALLAEHEAAGAAPQAPTLLGVPLTDVQYDTLTWIVAFSDAQKRVPTQREISRAFGIGVGTSAFRVAQLVRRGLLATHASGLEVLGDARELLAGGRAAAIVRPLAEVASSDGPLPESIPLPKSWLAIVQQLHAAAARGHVLTYEELAKRLGKNRASVGQQVKKLKLRGIVVSTIEHRARGGCLRLTALGVGLAEGTVTITRPVQRPRKAKPQRVAPQAPRARERVARPRKPRAKVSAPLPLAPPPPPAPVRREVGAATLPLPAQPPLAGALMTFRGIRHPAPPPAHAAPPGTSAGAWVARTTLPSMGRLAS